MNEFAVNEDIVWQFKTPSSPHMGGIWKRVIRTTRKVMYNIIKQTALTEFQLQTAFTEIERIVNNRSMTDVSDDVNDMKALTPNQFLLGCYDRDVNMKFDDICEYTCTTKRSAQVQLIIQHFWKHWLSKYLLNLTRAKKW